jgi:hypothetical protein
MGKDRPRMVKLLSPLRILLVLAVVVAPSMAQPVPLHTLLEFRFGNITLGSSGSLTDSMSNVGVDSLRVTRAFVRRGDSTFTVRLGYDTSDSQIGRTELLSDFGFPVTLISGRRLRIGVEFRPLSAARGLCFDDTLVVMSDSNVRELPISGCLVGGVLQVDRSTIAFGAVRVGTCDTASIRVSNTGNAVLQLRLPPLQPQPSVFHILDTTDIAIVRDSLALSIAPGETRTLRFSFCPQALDTSVARDTIVHTGFNAAEPIVLTGSGVVVTRIWDAPGAIAFGSVEIGTAVDTTIAVVNVSPFPQRNIRVELNQGVTDYGYRLLAPAGGGPVDVGAGETLAVGIRYAPIDSSFSRVSVVIASGTTDATSVQLSGRGVYRVDAEQIAVALEPAAGRVGDPVGIRVLVAPDLVAARNYRTARLFLQYDPHSFFPLETPGWRIASRFGGALTLERTDSVALAGPVLAIVRMVPLSTARAIDSVRLAGAEIGGEAVRIAEGLALIALEGCDLGRSTTIARALRVGSATIPATGGALVLEYRAPRGSHPVARVVDRSGVRLGDIALEEGTDGDQRVVLDLDGFPPGLLLIDLVVAGEHVTFPIMHAR